VSGAPVIRALLDLGRVLINLQEAHRKHGRSRHTPENSPTRSGLAQPTDLSAARLQDLFVPKPKDSNAISGVSHQYLPGRVYLESEEFCGGENAAARRLRELGFGRGW